MSESTAAPPSDSPLFTAVEIEQFEADDVAAGAAIGKMLSALFLYTVIVMLISSIVTMYWINTDHGATSAEVHSAE